MHIIIIGAGPSGLATALALTQYLNSAPRINLLELRSAPSTLGGAVGLTPNALRVLHHLGVLDVLHAKGYGVEIGKIEMFEVERGGRIGEISFEGAEGQGVGEEGRRFKGLRVLRTELTEAMLEVVRGKENVEVEFGRKVVRIEEGELGVKVWCEDGREVEGQVLVGCDGIHSVVRGLLVEKERRVVYTGIAAVFGFAHLREGQQVGWVDSALCSSRRGSLMCSYHEESRTKMFLAAIMETKEVESREGWVAKGKEQDEIKSSVKEKYCGSAVKCLDNLVERSDAWTLYPVYMLGPGGTWCTKRAMLLGDAAHAMPPQGESVGLALEDAVVFARRMADVQQRGDLESAFAKYERLRRPRADEAYEQATFGWDTQKDSGWFTFQLKNWLTGWFLWWTKDSRQRRYAEDIATVQLR